MADKIWDVRGTNHDISSRGFIATMLAFMLGGLGITGATSYVSQGVHLTWWMGLILFIGMLIGIGATAHKNLTVKLAGYVAVSGLMGVLLGPALALYTTVSILKVLALTTVIVTICGAIGITHPRSLESWFPYLFGGLLVLIVGYFGLAFFAWMGVNIGGALTFWEWAGLILFTFITIFDFNRAMRVERTIGNAIECGLSVYFDVVNIFTRLLSITGDRK